MSRPSLSLLSLLLLALLFGVKESRAQTQTIVNPAGQTVVVFVTQPAGGVAATQTISTLAAAVPAVPTTTTPARATTTPVVPATTTPLTTAPLTTQVQQGPVGAPATPVPGVIGGPTPYVYTTTNAAGQQIAVSDVFQPTPGTALTGGVVTPTSTGTVLGYSAWMSIVGTPSSAGANATGKVGTAASGGVVNELTRGGWVKIITIFAGAILGAFVVL